ncbi:hypothetical protein HF888_00340 [Bermanella marisrubri]|uniref:Signal transduction histidine kinase n=1 Tax=Bermanella marisrubri TaxID=207949 RepID=Q1MXJ8_9GAMM|nr:ATP-binding protein [Bermanella marisrubri]EAT10695.1 Signal transduction histidine kinase [Oceanobacter sp. RED65] [Bermanella marisrubri]QIZ82781.1 hypothetical protein HF888_00340 [Bermanella marisrubri]
MAFDDSILISGQLHDIKNQIQALLSDQHDLNEAIDHAHPARPIVEKLNLHGQGLKQRVVELLSILKLQHSGFKPCMEEHWLSDTLEPIINDYTQIHDVSVDLEIDEDFNSFYDDQLLSLAVRNALSNADQAGATNVKIFVEEYDDGHWRLFFIDNGPGFNDSVLNQTQFIPQGTDHGLGLYLIQQVMKLHKRKDNIGFIELGNHEQGGAQLSLVFP